MADRAPTRGLYWANEVLAFFLEVFALGALCYWGFVVGSALPWKLLLGLGAPVLAAVLWGLYAAPRARHKVPLVGVLAVKALVFGAAVAALYATDNPVLATVFAVVVVLNTTLATLGRRRYGTPTASP